MKEIDARGLACPAPVLMTKEALENEHPDEINVRVDNEAAKQNVSRFLSTSGFEASAIQEGNEFLILGKVSTSAGGQPMEENEPEDELRKIMVMVASDRIGSGDDGLGKKLMAAFLGTVKEMGDDLWRLVFVNNGVKLTVDQSEVLSVLQELETLGVHILVCGTCLNHFDLLEKKMVGETTNMLDIVTSMQLADKVINI